MTGDLLREPAPALSAAGLSDLNANADLFCDALDEVLQTLAPRVG
jgi:hypothetical protein